MTAIVKIKFNVKGDKKKIVELLKEYDGCNALTCFCNDGIVSYEMLKVVDVKLCKPKRAK